jgi:FkbM family methyltransferase
MASLVKKTIKGIPIWLNLKDKGISHRLVVTDGKRELAYDYIIKKEAGGIGLDVGANLGWASLLMKKKCEKVIAIEPDPRNLKLLRKNLTSKKFVIVPVAISAEAGRTPMKLAKKPNLNSLLDKTQNGDATVVTMTIDEIFRAIVPSLVEKLFIKMDIEGGEVKALQGGMEAFRKTEEVKILIEVHPKRYSAENNMACELKNLLSLGFHAKYVVNARGRLKNFEGYEVAKFFPGFPRAIFTGIPDEDAIRMATHMPTNGKKIARSILMVKE